MFRRLLKTGVRRERPWSEACHTRSNMHAGNLLNNLMRKTLFPLVAVAVFFQK